MPTNHPRSRASLLALLLATSTCTTTRTAATTAAVSAGLAVIGIGAAYVECPHGGCTDQSVAIGAPLAFGGVAAAVVAVGSGIAALAFWSRDAAPDPAVDQACKQRRDYILERARAETDEARRKELLRGLPTCGGPAPAPSEPTLGPLPLADAGVIAPDGSDAGP